MAECKECGKPIKAWEAIGGACEDCYSLYLKNKALLKEREANAERTHAVKELGSVLLTTAHTLQDVTVTKYLGVVNCG